MNTLKQMNWHLTLGLLLGTFLAMPLSAAEPDSEPEASSDASPVAAAQETPVDLFDAIDQGLVDVKFVARSAAKGRLVMTNKTKEPVNVLVPEAFAGVPTLRQFGGGGGGGGGLGGGGGGGQSVGGGGGGGGRGGGGGGAFNIAPEDIGRLDVPLLCLDHGLRDPSSNKPYEIRPIEDVVKSPALVEIVKAYANGELPRGASQAAAWNINSQVSWDELAAKLTGTKRNINRSPYFSRDEIQAAMAIVKRAETMTDGMKLEPRNWKSQSQRAAEKSSEETPAEESYEKKGKVIDIDLDVEDEPAVTQES